MSNAHHTVFYTGVTNNIAKRCYEHKNKLADGFTKKYNIDKLLYYEIYDDIIEARNREYLIKRWGRKIKFEAIEQNNPKWEDLYFNLI